MMLDVYAYWTAIYANKKHRKAYASIFWSAPIVIHISKRITARIKFSRFRNKFSITNFKINNMFKNSILHTVSMSVCVTIILSDRVSFQYVPITRKRFLFNMYILH